VGAVQDPGLVVHHRLTAVGTVLAMSSHTKTRRRRRLLALMLATVAVGMVVVEPFPKGDVLVSLTQSHGVDAGDLPAVALLLVAAWLAI
jgi:hypothetical protein